MSWIKNGLTIVLSTLIALEGGSFVASKLHLLAVNDDPPYSWNLKRGLDWRNEKELWGGWHKPNAHDEAKASCFDVKYRSNNVGARDDIDYTAAMPSGNVAVLGDSMVEGLGVPLEATFAHGLKAAYGKQGLNFGSAGNFGPLQEYILYRDLVKKIPHDEVVLFFLPGNDFKDNDYRGAGTFNNRYRPYFTQAADGGYSIVYPPGSKPSDRFPSERPKGFYDKIRTFLIAYTYFGNVVRSVYLLKDAHAAPKGPSTGDGYYTGDPVAVAGAAHYVNLLFDQVDPADKKTIVIIPDQGDIRQIRGKGWAYKQLDWYKGLQSIAASHNARFLDLALDPTGAENMDYLNKGYTPWFLTCDGHWSAAGNQMALDRYVAAQAAPAIAPARQKP